MSDIIRKLACNKPKEDHSGGKRFVVKACYGGEERIVRFGDSSMEHYKEGDSTAKGHGDEGRRANFKARHNCSEKKDKLAPGWWSCNWSW